MSIAPGAGSLGDWFQLDYAAPQQGQIETQMSTPYSFPTSPYPASPTNASSWQPAPMDSTALGTRTIAPSTFNNLQIAQQPLSAQTGAPFGQSIRTRAPSGAYRQQPFAMSTGIPLPGLGLSAQSGSAPSAALPLFGGGNSSQFWNAIYSYLNPRLQSRFGGSYANPFLSSYYPRGYPFQYAAGDPLFRLGALENY